MVHAKFYKKYGIHFENSEGIDHIYIYMCVSICKYTCTCVM